MKTGLISWTWPSILIPGSGLFLIPTISWDLPKQHILPECREPASQLRSTLVGGEAAHCLCV